MLCYLLYALVLPECLSGMPGAIPAVLKYASSITYRVQCTYSYSKSVIAIRPSQLPFPLPLPGPSTGTHNKAPYSEGLVFLVSDLYCLDGFDLDPRVIAFSAGFTVCPFL